MWYRSEKTGKIIPGTSSVPYDNILGEGSFDQLVEERMLTVVKNPSVVDILLENGSVAAASTRYREIHPDATLKEALAAVGAIKKDIARFGGKG